ncbi:BMC domain-containing protein [Fusobacterium hwasookii]|uniref:Ethanolamine utilization protein n=1 Tax=Fusobacterium hwasookii ChDC F206 TaxID=1307443 RepID=A0AAC9A0Q7_9FUSO|nr:BMC domain-containing protein [Fusobacterium hwasookii]ALQ34503.1 ethanolamine utilization protein [Fusobacterium hwasookii ChDC F206]QNE69280.1 BMC domain-containing protein [Fusobacterium hwasookii]QYR55669.1 BMC domain-containing protein [Fusobacterium hwasookii]
MLEALGLIEVVGLVGAIEAADTASKAADVKVIGYELTKGSGMVLVKIVGGVSAVKSAVDAACVAAERVSQIVSKHVIARPSDELDKIINVEEETQEEIIDNSEEQNEVIENNETDEVNEILEEIKEIQVVKGSKKHKNKK